MRTLRYTAPEQLRGHEVDPAWDLWAMTVMAYEMLAGVNPFAASGHSGMPQDCIGWEFYSRQQASA